MPPLWLQQLAVPLSRLQQGITDLCLYGQKGFAKTGWLLGISPTHALKQASVKSQLVKEFIPAIYIQKVRDKLMTRVPKIPTSAEGESSNQARVQDVLTGYI